VDEKEQKDEEADGSGSVSLVYEEHGRRRQNTAGKGGVPAEEFEGRPEVWGRADLEEETGKVRDEEGHLEMVSAIPSPRYSFTVFFFFFTW
jgi:hypothetical protein